MKEYKYCNNVEIQAETGLGNFSEAINLIKCMPSNKGHMIIQERKRRRELEESTVNWKHVGRNYSKCINHNIKKSVQFY